MRKKVIGYFEDNNQAGRAANELKAKGYDEISILGNENGEKEDIKAKDNNGMSFGDQNLSNGAITGGTIGGLAGLGLGAGALGALGAVALLIPGIGPIVAMGPLAAALCGVVTGGVAGALIDYGIPKDQSDFYETKIKEGNTVIVLKADEQKTDEVARMMRNNGAKDVRIH